MNLIATLIAAIVGFLAATFTFLLTRRRRTSRVVLDYETLPPIAEGLTTLAGISGANVFPGNLAKVYQNGSLFDAMAEDIEAARHTVHLESFVWEASEIETRLVELLTRKAGEGVKVRLMIDAMGGQKATPKQLERLCDAGVRLEVYCQPRWWNIRRMNHRTHRKLLIVDGRVGYTFGHGIAKQWQGNAEDSEHFRDTGVRLEGPVAHSMQSVFLENWIEESNHVPMGEGCFPDLSPAERYRRMW